MAQETIRISDGTGVSFQHRLRCVGNGDDSWHAVVTDNSSLRDTVQNGGTSAMIASFGNSNGGGGNYTIDRNYFSWDLSAVPADGTITAISVIFTTPAAYLHNIVDSDFNVLRLVKATTDATSPNGTTTANAIDHTVNNEADVNGVGTVNTDVTFNLGSSDLYDWFVAQHAAGNRAHTYLLTKLEYDSFVDSGAAEPTAGIATNITGFVGNGGAYSAQPRVVVTFTPAPPPPIKQLKIPGGSVKISSGTLKIK